MSDITIKENMEHQDEEINDEQIPLQKPLKEKKPRQPKTPKQLEQFENARLKRQANIQEKQLTKKIEASKLLLENGYTKAQETTVKHEDKTKVITKPKYKPDPIPIVSDDDSESENEIVIIKKKKKPKKKTYIIEASSDEDEDEEEKVKEVYRQSRQMVSQQNKKSIIKVHKNTVVPNYFGD